MNPVGVVYSEIIKEFFSNAALDEDLIECWVRHKEFVITREMVQILGGTPKKSSMNTIPFSPEIRALAHVMIHNLYLVTNLTTLSTGGTMFLYDLFTHKEIDICGHIFHTLKKTIKKQHSRTVMPFPSLIIGLIAKTRLKLLSGLTVV